MGESVHTRDHDRPDPKPWRLLLWAAAIGLLVALVGGGPLEDALRVARNKTHMHKASGDIVLVKIDNESLQQIGRWPWPRRYHAQLVDELTKAGAKRIFFDLGFFAATNPEDDQAFAESIRRSGRVVLPVKGSVVEDGVAADQPPLRIFSQNARLVAIGAKYNYQNAVWRLPYAIRSTDGKIPELAAMLAGRDEAVGQVFPIDYSVDPLSIPTLSASAVLSGKSPPNAVAGKDVVVGVTTNAAGDMYFIPGFRQTGGVFIQLIGGETLKRGTPWDLGWIPCVFLALLASAAACYRKQPRDQALILAGGVAALLFGTAATEARLIFLDVVPGLAVLLTVSIALGRRYYRLRGFVSEISGLPNLIALRRHAAGRDRAIVAAHVLNYSEIAAALPADKEQQLVDQIVGRLTVGAPDRTLFHGDGGIFAWFDDSKTAFAHHLEALSALFRNPLKVDGNAVDISVVFGVEIGSSRSLANRLASALVAADDAAHEGLKWKYHDPESLQDASWKLSMLSQLDEAIDRGEVWVAFQPKLDLKTREIIGAEALARWTHPEKGPIAATEFVAAAEQHDRIGKLTAFVLEQAISAAAMLNRRGHFSVAVNLSGKLLSDKALVGRIANLLDRYGVEPQHLTLELTESAAISQGGQALDALGQLRDIGVVISIDDYGTGLSTLEYLRKIPASEIKIDQSFVKGMVDNRSDRLMVQSTIALAHSLGRRVVAEGVEDRDILELLGELDCDIGQGFVIGRPMNLDTLRRRLSSKRREAA
jgi:EAL domain-containing protein (putative c-di-GMP-specific phosphodiesterase class I)/CHASE2 domain-containing sensor protein